MLFFDMGVVADVFDTVAVEPPATGAVPEFQIRVTCICPTADGTAVGMRGFLSGCLPGVGIKGNDLRPLGRGFG